MAVREKKGRKVITVRPVEWLELKAAHQMT